MKFSLVFRKLCTPLAIAALALTVSVAQAQEVAIFDALTGLPIGPTGVPQFIGPVGTVADTNFRREYMGQAFDAANIGIPIRLTRLEVYASWVNPTASAATINYSNVVARVQVYNQSSNATLGTPNNSNIPAFSSPAAPLVTSSAGAASFSAEANDATSQLLSFSLITGATPDGIALTDLVNNGLGISLEGFVGGVGQGISNALSVAVRNNPLVPFAAGDVPARNPDRNNNTVYYRNAGGLGPTYTGYNFMGSDARDVAPTINQQYYSSLAIRLYAQAPVAVPEPTTLVLAAGGLLGLAIARRKIAK